MYSKINSTFCLFFILVMFIGLQGCVSNELISNSLNIGKNKINDPCIKIDPNPEDSEEYDEKKYSILYDQGDYLEELVIDGFFRKAARLYEDNEAIYFLKKTTFSKKTNRDKHKISLDLIANYLNTQYAKKTSIVQSELNKYDQFPLIKGNWKEAKNSIRMGKKLIHDYNSYILLSDSTYRINNIELLGDSIRAFENKLNETAPDAFCSYHFLTDKNFFADYPTDISNKATIKKAFDSIQVRLQKAECENLIKFNSFYGNLLNKNSKNIISNIYLEHLLKPEKTKSEDIDLKRIIMAIKKAENDGFKINSYKDQEVTFVEVTNQTLLKNGYIEFPAKVNVDLPFKYKTCELEKVFADNSKSNFIVVFNVAQANVKRRILKKEQVNSNFLNGYKTIDNPEYRSISFDVTDAERGLASAQMTNCYSNNAWVQLACEITKVAAISNWRKKVNQCRQDYINTSSTIQEKVYGTYKFDVSNVDDTKLMTVNYYVIDKINKKYFESHSDINEQKSFRIAYNIKDADESRSSYLSKYNTEKDLEVFEKKPASVKLSSLIKDYIDNSNKAKVLVSERDLRLKMLKDKNNALVDYKKTVFETKSLDDPRFNNVVVIYNPDKSLGSGFFVAPHLVLTNYHVIDGSKFFEMKMYNGLETFGKVIKSDVRLDLALLKVEAKGEPVKFCDNKRIKLGADVEAIGHPHGLEFSITRGVVSALRKQKSVYDVGGKDILFVQTDAAINPGNSGGPLFYGNEVIGINNQKLVANMIEGLGFAIHYSEAIKFLEESF
jgi:serine protease Do